MSTTLSTQAMITELQARIPINLDSIFCLMRLNSAYRWMDTQGSFIWNFIKGSLSLLTNTLAVVLPTTAGSSYDPGRAAVMYGAGFRLNYIPPEDWALQRPSSGISGGPFSAWTVYCVPATPAYWAIFAPDSAMNTTGATAFDFYYHRMTPAPLTSGASIYFPTPDCFDDLIVDMAEAETRRLYSLAGWEQIQQKATASAVLLLDQYRTTTESISGLTDSLKRREEKAADRSRKAKD